MRITIKQRGPDAYRLRMEVGRDAGGKRLFKYETVRGSEDDAKRRRYELLTAHEQGTFTAPDKMTLKGFFDAWLKSRLALEAITRSTAENYEEIFKNYVAPTLGGKRLQAIVAGDIQGLYSALALEPVSSGRRLKMSSVAHIHRIVAATFRAARKKRLIVVNPMEEVEPPKTPKLKPKALDEDTTAKFLDALGEHPVLGITNLLGFAVGLRRGEMLGLRWGDVDLANAQLHVRGQIVQYRDNTMEWRAPKTESGARTVSIAHELVDVLRARRLAVMQERIKGGLGGKLDEAYVFTEDGVSPLKPNNLTHMFKYHCERLGLPARFSLHGTRHTHLTMLLRAVGKEGAKAVSQRAGHADIVTTLRTYQTVFESDDRNLANLTSGMFKTKKK